MTMQKIVFEEGEFSLSIKSGTKQLELEWGFGKRKLTCKRGVLGCFKTVCKAEVE